MSVDALVAALTNEHLFGLHTAVAAAADAGCWADLAAAARDRKVTGDALIEIAFALRRGDLAAYRDLVAWAADDRRRLASVVLPALVEFDEATLAALPGVSPLGVAAGWMERKPDPRAVVYLVDRGDSPYEFLERGWEEQRGRPIFQRWVIALARWQRGLVAAGPSPRLRVLIRQAWTADQRGDKDCAEMPRPRIVRLTRELMRHPAVVADKRIAALLTQVAADYTARTERLDLLAALGVSA